jgi:AraC-like DNA-binding protein
VFFARDLYIFVMSADLLPLALLSRLRIEPVIAYRAAAPAWALELDTSNPFYTWWLIERGGVRLRWDHGECSVEPGGAILIPPGLNRHHQMKPRTHLISVSFWAAWEDGRPLIEHATPLTDRGGGTSLASARLSAIHLCRLITGRTRPRMALGDVCMTLDQGLAFRAALDRFVAAIATWAVRRGGTMPVPDRGDVRLRKILADLRGNLRAGPLPYARWKDTTGLGRVQIDRLAHRWLGGSLRQRRDELLLQEIRRALAGGHDSMKELAARLGFVDAAHFSRWVKQRAGQSPRQLRGDWV